MFGWVAFLPLEPVFSGFLLDCLAHIPRYPTKTDDDYYLDANLTITWLRLERYINQASMAPNNYHAPPVRPFFPSACSYTFVHWRHNTACFCAELTRRGFIVWNGLLLYLNAINYRGLC